MNLGEYEIQSTAWGILNKINDKRAEKNSLYQEINNSDHRKYISC
jgi:hypothetical protein